MITRSNDFTDEEARKLFAEEKYIKVEERYDKESPDIWTGHVLYKLEKTNGEDGYVLVSNGKRRAGGA
ncbi:hypothetical protein HYV57_03135 [Candidatus Peregrinibacteria bacterium]|nr:hypothetical protein [Candidatus Peregrinibacteria bacterium]